MNMDNDQLTKLVEDAAIRTVCYSKGDEKLKTNEAYWLFKEGGIDLPSSLALVTHLRTFSFIREEEFKDRLERDYIRFTFDAEAFKRTHHFQAYVKMHVANLREEAKRLEDEARVARQQANALEDAYLVLSTKQAMQEIVDRKHKRVGFKYAYFLGRPEVKQEDGWYDLSEDDYHAQLTDEGLVMALWFNCDFIAPYLKQHSIPIMDERDVVGIHKTIKMVRVAVVIPETGLDYLYVDGRRTYFNQY